jgi:hypothetical protein
MRVLCAWCLKEGKPEDESLIGTKEPLEDSTETHGICPAHRKDVEDHVAALRAEAERRRQEAERQRDDIEALRKSVDP